SSASTEVTRSGKQSSTLDVATPVYVRAYSTISPQMRSEDRDRDGPRPWQLPAIAAARSWEVVPFSVCPGSPLHTRRCSATLPSISPEVQGPMSEVRRLTPEFQASSQGTFADSILAPSARGDSAAD